MEKKNDFFLSKIVTVVLFIICVYNIVPQAWNILSKIVTILLFIICVYIQHCSTGLNYFV